MSEVRLFAERVIEAPAEVVYRCIADYQRHHRPDGFLPPAFNGRSISMSCNVSNSMRVP